jgi:hypothetical protein
MSFQTSKNFAIMMRKMILSFLFMAPVAMNGSLMVESFSQQPAQCQKRSARPTFTTAITTAVESPGGITRLNLFRATATASAASTPTTTPLRHTEVLDHRHSASDWLYNIKSFPQSKVLREVRNPVLAVTGWSFLVAVVHRLLLIAPVPSLNAAAYHICIPGTAHSFLVSALGLLLVFRTNSAYQRFNVSNVFGICALVATCGIFESLITDYETNRREEKYGKIF